MIKPTETLYKKQGRKYVPVESRDTYDTDIMPVGSFKLVYAYAGGGRRYEYAVTPATATTAAAMLIAKHAMCEAIREAAKMRPQTPKQYTKKQLAIIEQFKRDMGNMYPSWWQENEPYLIADAAIKAVLEFRP